VGTTFAVAGIVLDEGGGGLGHAVAFALQFTEVVD